MERRLACLLSVLIAFSSAALAQPSGEIRHRAVRSGVPTSAALIDAALTSGKIDAETALEYRVFAAFADCRLPMEFRGDDSNVMSTSILQEVAARFPTLSAAAQSTLLPFLREPYEPDGWVAAQEAICGSGKTAPTDLSPKAIVVLGGKVAVIYRDPGDATTAGIVAAAIETTIYPKLTALMGEPLPYPMPFFDGVVRWDVSLVPNIHHRAVTGYLERNFQTVDTCGHAPAFTEIKPTAPHLLSVVAHELMHAIEQGYPISTPCFFPEYVWISEATATWAMDFVYKDPPEGDAEHEYASEFLDLYWIPLERDSADHLHPYGAYLLPFYIDRHYGDPAFVRRIWDAAGKNLSLPAVDQALTQYGGFEKEWPEFVRYNWNREPYDDYRKWDRLEASPYYESHAFGGTFDEVFEDKTLKMIGLNLELNPKLLNVDPLSAQYFHFDVTEPTARSIAFVNGFTFKLGIRQWATSPELGNLFVLDNRSQTRNGAKIQALLKINGIWEKTPRDWTKQPYVEFCRDVASERLDEVVIIYSNSDYKNRDPIVPEGLNPMLWASNMGCSGWKTAQATFEASEPIPLKMTFNAKFTRVVNAPQPMQTLPAEGLPLLFILYNGSGLVEWSVNGTYLGCTYTGGATFPLEAVQLTTANFAPPEGTMHRLYTGTMLTTKAAHYSVNCGSGPVDTATVLPLWTIVFPPIDRNEVSSSGTIIKGDHGFLLASPGRWSWVLVTDPP